MNIFIEQLHINPFVQSITIASAVMKGFRKRFLKPDMLGIIPTNQYNLNKNASLIGRKWIEYIGIQISRDLLTEYKLPIGGILVDGYDIETNTVYEFFGCYFHGCRTCFPHDSHFIDEKNTETQNRIIKIRSWGYNLVIEWEHDFLNLLKESPEIELQICSRPRILHGPINIRDAVFGGIVDVFNVFYEVKPGEKILA